MIMIALGTIQEAAIKLTDVQGQASYTYWYAIIAADHDHGNRS